MTRLIIFEEKQDQGLLDKKNSVEQLDLQDFKNTERYSIADASKIIEHEDFEAIHLELKAVGVHIERWHSLRSILSKSIKDIFLNVDETTQNHLREVMYEYKDKKYINEYIENITNERITDIYSHEIMAMKSRANMKSHDLININPEFAKKDSFNDMRIKFNSEHTHSDDEVRYFIDGSGLFTIRVNQKIYQLLCTAGDCVNVPAKTLHWFDMGSNPYFKCIRFFSDEAGWLAEYTDSNIAEKYLQFEDLLIQS